MQEYEFLLIIFWHIVDILNSTIFHKFVKPYDHYVFFKICHYYLYIQQKLLNPDVVNFGMLSNAAKIFSPLPTAYN